MKEDESDFRGEENFSNRQIETASGGESNAKEKMLANMLAGPLSKRPRGCLFSDVGRR